MFADINKLMIYNINVKPSKFHYFVMSSHIIEAHLLLPVVWKMRASFTRLNSSSPLQVVYLGYFQRSERLHNAQRVIWIERSTTVPKFWF